MVHENCRCPLENRTPFITSGIPLIVTQENFNGMAMLTFVLNSRKM